MLRFYTPADRNKSFFGLYKIESIGDYIESISRLDIDVCALRGRNTVHPDYEFIEDYLSRLIEKSSRVCFLGVYDFEKEAYFINKYPGKEFVVGDISMKALSGLERNFPNITVCETILDDFDAKQGDLIVINIAEYFMNQDQLKKFVSKGENVVLNNVHLYIPGWRWIFFRTVSEVKSLVVNILSLASRRRQRQFRGWWRTVGDFLSASQGSGKYVKTIVFNEQLSMDTKYGRSYKAMVHFESKV